MSDQQTTQIPISAASNNSVNELSGSFRHSSNLPSHPVELIQQNDRHTSFRTFLRSTQSTKDPLNQDSLFLLALLFRFLPGAIDILETCYEPPRKLVRGFPDDILKVMAIWKMEYKDHSSPKPDVDGIGAGVAKRFERWLTTHIHEMFPNQLSADVCSIIASYSVLPAAALGIKTCKDPNPKKQFPYDHSLVIPEFRLRESSEIIRS